MASVTMTLRRVFSKGHLCFEVPTEPELQTAMVRVLTTCREKKNDFVNVTLDVPHKPRTTGDHSQNHHLNGHIVQICNFTGQDYETIKYCVKMIAVEQFGYPFVTIQGHVIPKRERDCNTVECAMLIEAAHYLAAQLGIVLRETEQ